jgi:hypothetical protein
MDRPYFDDCQGLMLKLIRGLDKGWVTPFPSDCLHDISEFLTGPRVSGSQQLQSIDLYDRIRIDLLAHPNTDILNGRDMKGKKKKNSKKLEPSAIWPAMMNARKDKLGSQDVFAAIIDLGSTPKGMGVFTLRIPDSIKNFGPYISSNDDAPLPKKKSLKNIIIGTAVTPTGWYTPPHYDYEGGAVSIVHMDGIKVWVTFPRSPHNRDIMEPTCRHAFGLVYEGEEVHLVDVIDQLEDVSCYVFEDPKAFMMGPFEYHACICIRSSVHIGGPVWARRYIKSTSSTIVDMLDKWDEALKKEKQIRLDVPRKMGGVIQGLKNACELDPMRESDRAAVKRLEDRVSALEH